MGGATPGKGLVVDAAGRRACRLSIKERGPAVLNVKVFTVEHSGPISVVRKFISAVGKAAMTMYSTNAAFIVVTSRRDTVVATKPVKGTIVGGRPDPQAPVVIVSVGMVIDILRT
jgi:hypothetical protein